MTSFEEKKKKKKVYLHIMSHMYQIMDTTIWSKCITISFQEVYCDSEDYRGIYELTVSQVFLTKY